MKPVVGVVPLWDDKMKSIWMLPNYLDGIREAGGIPFVFPLIEDEDEIRQLMDLVQGVLLTGGHDVSPCIYGEECLNDSVVCCEGRDKLEQIVVKVALEQNKPVLGICRGIQIINSVLGGTLYQDLPTQHKSDVVHRQKAPYDSPVHDVFVEKNTPLYEIAGKDRISVNSLHHQAIKNLAPSLSVMATSTDDLIEGIYMPDKKFFWAVQWHPEFAYKKDETQRKIFDAFVDSMK